MNKGFLPQTPTSKKLQGFGIEGSGAEEGRFVHRPYESAVKGWREAAPGPQPWNFLKRGPQPRLVLKRGPGAAASDCAKTGAGGGSPLEKEEWFWFYIPVFILGVGSTTR